MKVVIAEDQNLARLVLAEHLKSWGHEVVETVNGLEALHYIAGAPEGSVDMLITDWSMPEMDGIALARKVRALSEAAGYVYIVLLTSRGEHHDILKGFSEGEVDDYVVKPFEAAELKMRIKVGERLVRAERRQRLYGRGLEEIVRKQTEAIRETQGEIISRLFGALRCRDEETGDHVRRIGLISSYMGRLLNWPEEKVSLIREAAPLHDVGKIGIPDSILRKPGPLSFQEYEIIKRHSLIGANLLSGSHNPVIRLAETVARHHHENWDGSGYPDGLKGLEIPQEARIVAVADVYDALMSDRVYRLGLPQDKVLAIMASERGRKFDPELLDMFLKHLAAIREFCEDSERDLAAAAANQGLGRFLDF